MPVPFKIGDIVAVLDDTIKGIITNINKETITIETEDSFTMNYNVSELILYKTDQKELSKYVNIKQSDFLERDTRSSKSRPFKKTSKQNKQPPLEVDLHIHQLVQSTKGMSNYDMLTKQIETAKRQLEFAIKKKIQRVVFIHGVGEGVLKKELEFLLAKYNVEVYPASFQKYGFGATEIYIYQNS